jgi:hypothetical protein
MRTTSGSVALVNSIPKGDAPVVAKLRAQGIIIVGKANLTEFGNFKGDIPWGWSSLGGQTQSAYGPLEPSLVNSASVDALVEAQSEWPRDSLQPPLEPKSTDLSPNHAPRLRCLVSKRLLASFLEKVSWEFLRPETPLVPLRSRLMMSLSFSALWPSAA